MSDFSNIKKPLIYLITKGNLTDENFPSESFNTLELIKSAVEQEISLIQIREKNLSAKFIYQITVQALEIAKKSNSKILVNERADIAFAAQADGVHLTSKAIPTKTIRQNFPSDLIIGVSTHSLAEAEKATNEGADFVTFSPIFPTISKQNYGEPQGLEELKKVGEQLKPFPVIALGGIDETNYQMVLQNGASGFAGISFFQIYKRIIYERIENLSDHRGR